MTRTISNINSIILAIALGVSMVIFEVPKAQAETPDAKPLHEIEYKKADRKEILKKFLDKHNSPLTANVDTFIKVADEYNIDYKLLPAISCMESTCGQFLIEETYNPFGWGGGLIYFDSYNDAIEGVAKGLDEIYLSRGLDTPEKIAPVYTPPNHANWLKGVYSFMNQMDTIALEI